jgi:NodT family efflux transporter outer membrane factor (OMF) lipoprotein
MTRPSQPRNPHVRLASRLISPLSLRFRLPSAAVALLASGCAVGPNFHSPAAPAVDQVTAQPLPAQTATSVGAGGEAQQFIAGKPLSAQWWKAYQSPKLDALVDQALAASPSIASAQAALRQARETLNAQRGAYFPSIDGSAQAERQKIDSSSFGQPAGGALLYNLYNASVSVSYSLDVFGGERRTLESQKALVEYQQFELEATYQTLVANVVTAAVSEARLRRLMYGEKQIVEDLGKQLKITNARFEAGAVSRADVLSAQTSLATEQATLITLELQLSQAQNQLAVYLGQLPSERASTDFELAELTLPQEIPLTLPSELVRQRPDIRAAEAQLHSASAEIGVATADLFPSLSISGSYGTQASKTGNLFKSDVWSLSGSLTAPIFHGGTLTAKRRVAIAEYDQAAAEYRSTVLNAFQNVADALYQVEADARSLAAQTDARDAAEKSLKLVEIQYKLGGASYVQLLTSEQQYINANTNFVTAQAARFSDTAALFQALGGGWWNRDANAPIPQAAASTQPIFFSN